MKTHRCDGIRNNVLHVSIRKCNPYPSIEKLSGERWWLHQLEIDYDYDSKYLTPVVDISYCPFCGEMLE